MEFSYYVITIEELHIMYYSSSYVTLKPMTLYTASIPFIYQLMGRI